MKSSLILTTTVKFIIPLLLIFSFFLLLRGHNEPGGGFSGGLVAASAYALFAIANGVSEAIKFLKVDPIFLIGCGLLIALISALLPLLSGESFMTGVWLSNEIPVVGKLGTPLVFDIGVYILVLGIASKIIFSLSEDEE